MDKKTLEILEYNKLIKLLSDHASSELGKIKCASLHPLRNREAILNNLENTSDAVARILSSRKISFSGNKNLEEIFKAMAVEANLDGCIKCRMRKDRRILRSYGRKRRFPKSHV